ncbi:MAG: hypothetical protein AAGF59_01545 [Pseudomonadota bacterium]
MATETGSSTIDGAYDPGGYFEIMERALSALEGILREERPGPWGSRPNKIINAVALEHLGRLKRNFVAWDMRRMFAENFQIDAVESGFPVFRHVMDLERTQSRIAERLEETPEPADVRREMLDLILKFKQHPGSLQKVMAERLYLEALQRGDVFPAFHAPETLRVTVDKATGRLIYVLHWAAYDGTQNLPMVYLAVIEDSSVSTARSAALERAKKELTPSLKTTINGLPNPDLSEAFTHFAANHSQYGLTLTSIATALDADFDNLHPKHLRRFILGPFYGAGETRHPDTIQSVLDSARTPDRSWILTWTMQELQAKKEIAAKRGIWNSEPARQIFYIDTNDVECVQQGVSAFSRNALVPHDVYQAVFAAGDTGSVFAGHECAILSEDQVLRNL